MSPLFVFLLGPFLFSPMSLGAGSYCEDKPVILVSTEYPPYQSEKVRDRGVFNLLVGTALKVAGCKINFISLPWKRALVETQNGDYDAILGIWHSVQREKWFLYSEPIIQNQLSVIKRKKDKFIFDKATIHKYTMGLVQDYAYPDEVKNLNVLRIEYAPDDRMGLMMLVGGRVDFVVLDGSTVTYLLAHDLKNIKDKIEVGEVLAKTPLYVGFSLKKPTAPLLAKRLRAGLRKMEKSGELKVIRKRAQEISVEILQFSGKE